MTWGGAVAESHSESWPAFCGIRVGQSGRIAARGGRSGLAWFCSQSTTLHKNPLRNRDHEMQKETTYPLQYLLHKNSCLRADFS